MRTKSIALVTVLVAVLSTSAYAQATLPKPTEPRDVAAASFTGRVFGSVDFGGRFTSVDGDPARYERYRDLTDGPFAERFIFERRREDWTLEAFADKIGYKDQR